MFRNFSRRFASSSAGSAFRSGHHQFKLNNSVRSFSSSSAGSGTSTLSPAMKSIISGGLLLGAGYYLTKTMNQPNETFGRFDTTNELQLAQQRLVQPDMTRGSGLDPIVQRYLRGTFGYVALNVALTTVAAVAAFKSGLAFKLATMNPWASVLLFTGGFIGTAMATRAVDINTNRALKHTLLVAFNTLVGMSLCTIGFVYRPEIILRAALYTAGIFGALSYVAMNAHQEKFLNMGGALLAGLTVVFLSSFAPLVLPATMTRTLQVTEYIWLYGGLLLFGLFVLYDAQKVIQKGNNYKMYVESEQARGTPAHLIRQPDYINSSLGLYTDVVNIFIRLLYILGGNNRRK
ncbi:hypothetical protein C9374_007453 [Naegleria lovaniensis]|uniref:Uncharacterized protein n=1 Tax=Naegleria lovaniensis TaxID=51637 RepID=A0AA88GH53_NAELO|nr:uncharacterized protein C9374_007453 [Naegleria lovaniensis]KAG2379314.1 hypothetical protein C9374_007453 [Naegleria lovaniensis]